MEIEFISSEPQDKLVENFVQEEKANSQKASTALNTLLIKLAKKETTLLSIVRDLQSFLTSTNQTHRTRGCLLLSNIFERFQDLTLDSQEFDSLYEFFISKMTDVATTLEALKVIRNLLVRNNKPKKTFEDDKKLFDSFIGVLESKSFHTPAYNQEVRYVVYEILRIFTQDCEKYCVDMNDKFVSIVLGAIEEEQDPRNLMVSFKLVHFLLDKMSAKTLELYKNDIYEALSMYYPISFTPPENDVIKITPQDLESELNMCLCHPILIELTMDLVFDKLTASQDEAKIACLRTLEQIIKANFSRTFVAKYGEDIWSKIKLTYYHSISAPAEEACINFLQSFIKQPLNVSVDKGLNSGVLDHIIEKITSSCFLDIQKGSATQNASKSIKILLLISSISEDNSTTILNRFCALFLEKCEIQNISECQAWLEYFYRLYDVWSKFTQDKADFKGTLFGLKLETFKATYQRIKDILDSTLSNEPIKIIALRIYAHATNLLYKSISYKAGYEYLCQLISVTTQSPMMKECVGDALVIASEGNEIPEVDETIANVIEIFDKIYCKDEVAQKGSLEDYFSHNPNSIFYYLKTFSSRKQFRGKILSLLLRFLTLHLQKTKASSEHLIPGVKTLKQIVINMTEEKKKVANTEQFESAEREIYELLVANSNLEKGLLQFKQADKVKYKALKQDFKNILSQMSSSQNFVKNSFDFFIDVLQKETYQNADLKIIGWLFEAMSQKAFQAGPKEAISVLISTIQTKNISTKQTTFAVGKILRAFVNKTNDYTIQKPLIEYFVKTFKETGELSKLVLYSYTIKGLITRGDMMGFQCLVQFFNTTLPLIQDAKHTDLLISCYKIIIKDLKRDFSEFVISATSKQRLFSIIFPYVYTLYKKGKEENVPEVKEFFTVIIMYLITQIPFKIMKSSFQQILPIILENMSKFKEQFEKQLDNIEYSIDFISKILGEKEETNYEVEDLVDHLLYIVRALREKQSTVSTEFYVRNYSAILKTLLQISKFPLKNPKRLHTEVIETLSADRDNRKREIRKYVTRCINAWSNI